MQELGNEAEIIYFAIFKKRIPETIRQRFDHISKRIDRSYPGNESERYYHYLLKVKDLEALELMARHSGKLPILTDKFKIMVYIAETYPENYDLFINEDSCRVAGYVSLLLSLLRSGFKLVKGMVLFAVH